MMKGAAVLASLAVAEGSTSLKLAFSDCGAAHGKITGLTPDTLPLGSKTTATGSGTVDKAVSGGTFEMDLKASIISQTFKGDLCSAKSFNLPLGTGSIQWDGLKCPVAAGAISVPVDITLSANLPSALQSVDLKVSGADSSGAALLCMDIKTSPAAAQVNYKMMFDDFKKTHAKTYSDAADEEKRFEIFKLNIDFINEMNAKGNKFELGVTPFADLTADEFDATHFGIKKPDQMWGSLPNLGTHQYKGEALAASVDWTTKGAVTPVKNQGQCGSCWSFSTTGSLEGASQIASGNLVSLSEQQFVDCDKVDSGCSGGLMDNAFKFAEANAICTEDSYPYTAKGGTCASSSCTVGLAKGSVTGFKDVSSDSEQAMMSAIAQQPVSIAIEADKSVFQLYKSGVLKSTCGSNLDHGVLAVGYGTEDGQDYWLVKNSWGSSWGASGFIKLLRGKGGAGECGLLKQASYPVVSATAFVTV